MNTRFVNAAFGGIGRMMNCREALALYSLV